MTEDVEQQIAGLVQELVRYPANTNPLEHATLQFHLGALMLDQHRLAEAQKALDTAGELFEGQDRPADRAKVDNARGAALRAEGKPEDAAEALQRAADTFAAEGMALEEGAARHNLGLVHRDREAFEESAAALRRAKELLPAEEATAQAAAVARELGGVLFGLGELYSAAAELREATELAHRARDLAGVGVAQNTLGLVHMAAGRHEEAVEAFASAAGANPPGVRDEGYAMAKANLGLTHQRAGAPARARLAAHHALSVAQAPEPVRAQAQAVLDDLGEVPGDVLPALAEEPEERRPAMWRQELVRWARADADQRVQEATALIQAQVSRPLGEDTAAEWLGALLELPPEDMDAVIAALVAATEGVEDETAERFRFQVSRAMVRFHVPQWTRMAQTFDHHATERGHDTSWQ